MLSLNFILGKREREPIHRIKIDTHPYRYSLFECGEGTLDFPYLKKNQFSYKTDRDFEQPIGKLYKGDIVDNEEYTLYQQQSGPTLVKRRKY